MLKEIENLSMSLSHTLGKDEKVEYIRFIIPLS